MMKNQIYILALLLSMSGCTTVKRYKSIESTSSDNTRVGLDLFGTKVEAAKEDDPSKSLWDLQAEGQAALINALNARNKDDEKFSAQLNGKYLKTKEKKITDYTNKDLKLIFSISKTRDYAGLKGANPPFTLADRIEYLKFSITIPDNTNLNFIKWNKFSTEYATVDVADMSFSQSVEVAGSLGSSSTSGSEQSSGAEGVVGKLTTGSALTPSISAKGSASKTETQKVKYRYVQLNGAISDKQIKIEQEGMREIDLTGNVIADVNLKFEEIPEVLVSAEGLKDAATGAFNPASKVKLLQYPVLVPRVAGLPATIEATLNYDYAYRHVRSRAKTYFEWDDRVSYITGSVSKTITLFRRKDYVPAFAHIAGVGEDALPFNGRTKLMLQEDFGAKNTFELIFNSNSEAADFLSWLTRYPLAGNNPNNPIILGSYRLRLRSAGADKDLTYSGFQAISGKMAALPYYR